jgi:hypothetical protein
VNSASPVAQNIALNDIPDWFYVKNLTNWGKASTADSAIYSEWFSYMAAGSYLQIGQNSSGTPSSVTMYAGQGTSGGFTFLDPANPTTYPVLVATSITPSTGVVLMANTGSIAVGDTVRITNAVDMQQISGGTFQVTAVSSNVSITLGYFATAVTAGLTIAGTASSANVQKVISSSYYPRARRVYYVTQATQAVVYFAAPNDFTPGEIVDFTIPVPFGMNQLSFQTATPFPARVLSVVNTATQSSIVITTNTSGFGAFVYPTTANILSSANPPTCYPAGSGVVPLNGSATIPQSPPGTNLVDAFDNRSQYLMNIGSSVVGAASTTMVWFAFKSDYNQALSNA